MGSSLDTMQPPAYNSQECSSRRVPRGWAAAWALATRNGLSATKSKANLFIPPSRYTDFESNANRVFGKSFGEGVRKNSSLPRERGVPKSIGTQHLRRRAPTAPARVTSLRGNCQTRQYRWRKR